MRLGPLIAIQTTPAQLGLNIYPGSMQLKQRHASMHLQQPQADMQVKAANGQLHVDNSAVRQDLGVVPSCNGEEAQARFGIRTPSRGARRAQRRRPHDARTERHQHYC